MIYPAINDLMNKVDSRYSLVVATAKRARELVNGSDPLVGAATNKPVSLAVMEIYEGKILFENSSDRKLSYEEEFYA
ncbi:MAG: DNA-directed RNA polymerase subunit omega [Clostridiales bacterium]|jgi:DNA-directed RNA polymerase subunit omega|nr:DNA-directed RNA polymerase subunit omega [Clostridiales bacterium]